MTDDTRLWHGGIPGLRVGDLLLPPSVSGNDRIARIHARLLATRPGIDPDAITPDDASPDWVHFTPHRNVALAYAGTSRRDYGSGALYVVDPIGEVETDPDFPVQGLRAHAARIVTVYDPHVNISEARAANLHAIALAVERGTTIRQQKDSLHRFVHNAERSTRPPQTIMMTPAQDRAGA
jgi:hypothetical protein